MAVPQQVTVLVVAGDRDVASSYLEALRSAEFTAAAASSFLEMAAAVRDPGFDIVVIDSVLDDAGLSMVEHLAALPRRPRMVAVTSRPASGAPLEWFFDFYLEKPCTPGFVVDAVRSIELRAPATRDLLIISRDRVGIYDVLERFGRDAVEVEIRLDRRRGQRRRDTRRRRFGERRRGDRRTHDVTFELLSHGWAFVPAASRA
jgi:DNA-binding response OmpR family regulator